MHKKVIFILFNLVAGFANAGNNGTHLGSNVTTGNVANEHSVFIGATNPAHIGLAVREGENFRFNFTPALWNYSELGNVDNFIDDLDELIDILDDPSNVEDSVEDVLDRFNDTLVAMGEEGYATTSAGIAAPVLPLFFRANSINTVFNIGLTYGGVVGMRILDDELSFDEQNGMFATNTSAYVKSAIETRLSLGASTRFYSLAEGIDIYGGVKANFIRMEMSKQLIALQQMNGESIEDVIEDAYDNNLTSTNNIGIDLGVSMVAERFRVGASATDINSPSFNYGPLGVGCEQYPDASIERSNCDTATYFIEVAGEIVSRERYTRHALLTLDGMFRITKNWFIAGEIETAIYNDAVGQENQWYSLSTAYESGSYLIPSLRLGYRQNLAGSELSMTNMGITLGGVLTLDFIYGRQEVEVDGNTVPRALGFSIAIQERF